MTQETYMQLQLSNLDTAIELGKSTLESALSLQALNGNNPDSDTFSMDSLKYYDFSDALKQLQWMQSRLKDFKNIMIEIKISNDKMLLDGGFIASIDREITHVFLSHVLCKMDALDPRTVEAIQDAIQTLEKLKKELSEM